MRARTGESDTQELYRELRPTRLEILELARSGKVALSAGSAEQFEKLMSDLGRYHADTR